MTDGTAERRTVFGRALRILDAFADAPEAGLTLTQIAQRTRLPMTTVHRMIGQLETERVVESDVPNRYRVGLRLWELGLLAPRAQELRGAALPVLADLQEVTHQHVQLLVLDGTEAVVVERLSAPDAAQPAARTAGRLPAHATSGGVVLLAHADERVLQAVLDGPMASGTAAAVATEPQLRAAMSLVRRQGWILLRDPLGPNAVSVAAPVTDQRQRVIAAVSVVSDVDDGDRVVPALRTAARAIGRTIGSSGGRGDAGP